MTRYQRDLLDTIASEQRALRSRLLQVITHLENANDDAHARPLYEAMEAMRKIEATIADRPSKA